jgi:hypothetical protein
VGVKLNISLGEAFRVSQSTVSRAIKAIMPLVAKACASEVPAAEDLDEHTQYVVDGTLLPCWSWASNPEPYSGKRKATGLNVQVACILAGLAGEPGVRAPAYCRGEFAAGIAVTAAGRPAVHGSR